MELKSFDNKRIQVADPSGDVFEGVAEYCGAEYVDYLIGREVEAVQLANHIFCKDDIKYIREIKLFSAPYGLLEKNNAEEIGLVEDILLDHEDIYGIRMLAYLSDHPDLYGKELIPLLEKTIKYSDCARLTVLARRLLKKLQEEYPED